MLVTKRQGSTPPKKKPTAVVLTPSAGRTAASGTPSGGASELELLLEGQAVVELRRGILAGFRHFFYQLFRFDDCLENLALVGFAQHPTDKHFEQYQQRLVQRKDQIQFANYFLKKQADKIEERRNYEMGT